MNVVILGCGLVGKAIVHDLSIHSTADLTVVDARKEALVHVKTLPRVQLLHQSVNDERDVEAAIAGADLVIGALPGFMGFEVLRSVIRAGKNVVDISFFPEDAMALDDLAKERGVTAVVDCGLAPGLSNLVLGQAIVEWDEVQVFNCYVGGLPRARTLPYEYKAVFSPIDVLEEYTRPARLRERGETVVREALSEVEHLEFPGVGTLEAFNTDGLRTLLQTVDVPDMKEKTLRYPGHAEKMRLLRDTGFFSPDPVEVRGGKIRPLDLTARLLCAKWKLEEGEEDLTVMRVEIRGRRNRFDVSMKYELYDYYDVASGITSMARTTGYTCAVTALLLLDGKIAGPGVIPPEYLPRNNGVFSAIMTGLADRGVRFNVNGAGS